MHLTKFEALMSAIGALVAIIATCALGMRWIYRQGVSSQKLINAVDANTQATRLLTGAYEKFTEKTDGTLFDHEKRITRLEASGP